MSEAFQMLRYEERGNVAVITYDRQERRNALSVPMYRISRVTFEVRLRVTERVRFWTEGARKLGSKALRSPVRSVTGITVLFGFGRKVGWTGMRPGLATSCSRLK